MNIHTSLSLEMITLCQNCDNVHPDSHSRPSFRWLCIAHPKLPGFDGFVVGEHWEKDEPFLRCRDVNGGKCHLFTPKRGPQMELINE